MKHVSMVTRETTFRTQIKSFFPDEEGACLEAHTMITRDRYPFDPPASFDDAKYFNLFAVSADQRTFYVTAGANNGYRLLAHYDADGILYTADRLHPDSIMKATDNYESVVSFLRRAADRATDRRELVRVAKEYDGMQDPPEKQRDGKRLPIPGFSERYYDVARHNDLWFTRTEIALPLPAPAFAPTAQVWDIHEGVYMYFPAQEQITCPRCGFVQPAKREGPLCMNPIKTETHGLCDYNLSAVIADAKGSYRLIPRKEYYDFCAVAPVAPVARQGDLLFFRDYNPSETTAFVQQEDEGPLRFSHGGVGIEPKTGDQIDEVYPGNPEMRQYARSLDRHQFVEDENVVRHPEHGQMDLPDGTWTAVLIPGTSRPFQRSHSRD